MPSLIVWMNGERVGEWRTLRGGTHLFRYERSWADSPRARTLSLSIPLTADLEVRGRAVESYFDNLLPDSPEIRRRLRVRFGTRSTEAFDLLAAIGRDCVGAVQLLPEDQEPVGWNRIEVTALKEREVEATLRGVTISAHLGASEQDEFRISLAGAQEKTALLRMGGRWYRTREATPTTHILKLPLGIVGNFRGDFSDSVENEWLCAEFLREAGLPVAQTEIGRFGEERALVVTRFDRRWVAATSDQVAQTGFRPSSSTWIARLPQEDLCQAMALPPTQRYEADGGPSIEDALGVLANSEDPRTAQTIFLLSQLAFWLLAATDGHGKNFSLHQRAGGTYGLAPLYDVVSAWPVIGRGKNQLAYEKAKLAMAVRGGKRHYRLSDITARHWQELARRSGVAELWSRMCAFVDAASPAFERTEGRLPRAFPERVYTSIRNGITSQTRRFRSTMASGPR